MSDVIERQKALDALKGKLNASVKDTEAVVEYLDGVIERILQLPSAQPERKTGRWIHIRTESDGNALYECSECHKGEVHVPIVEVHYCWNCGARMVGGEF